MATVVMEVKRAVEAASLVDLLVSLEFAGSEDEARRLVQRGKVRLENETFTGDPDAPLAICGRVLLDVTINRWTEIFVITEPDQLAAD